MRWQSSGRRRASKLVLPLSRLFFSGHPAWRCSRGQLAGRIEDHVQKYALEHLTFTNDRAENLHAVDSMQSSVVLLDDMKIREFSKQTQVNTMRIPIAIAP